MKKAPDFASAFAERLREYVAFEKSSGKGFRVEASILKAFDRYALEHLANQMDEGLVNNFAYSVASLSSLQYRKRHRTVRRFSEYLSRLNEGQAVRPLPKMKNPGRHIPYVYTEEEISALMAAAEKCYCQAEMGQLWQTKIPHLIN